MLTTLNKPAKTINEEAISLPEELMKNNFCYKLIKRTSHKSLYQQAFKSGRVIAHELFQIRHKTKQDPETGERFLYEVFPNDEAFGDWAYSLPADQEKALKRFNSLGKPKNNGRL